MDLQATFTLFLAVLALALKPGPGMMALMSRTLSQGMRGCLLFILGIEIASLFYLGLVLMGLKFAQEDLIFISILLKAFAAVYLIYLGVKGLQNPEIDLSLRELKEERLFDNLTAAMMLTLSNPLVILFFGGLLPSLINVPEMTVLDMAIIAGVMVGTDALVIVAYCLPIAYARHLITGDRLTKVNIFSSAILILVGLYIGYTALPAQDLLSVSGQ